MAILKAKPPQQIPFRYLICLLFYHIDYSFPLHPYLVSRFCVQCTVETFQVMHSRIEVFYIHRLAFCLSC